MTFTKKIDRARQWAGEKMGADTKTALSDEFRMLEAEMGVRQAGIDGLQKSSAIYVKWASRRCDTFEDKNRGTPMALLGRTMVSHANDLEPDSEFGSCLAHVGQVNERVADLHNSYAQDVTTGWMQFLERSVAMMKEYQSARKKLESRRLAYDASLAKMQKAKRDDFRVEDEMRVCKTKFDDSTEDLIRRMQDIKDTEADNVAAVTSFLDTQLAYHERAADELRRAREALADMSHAVPDSMEEPYTPRPRSNTARAAQHTSGFNNQDAAPTYDRAPMRRLAGSQALPSLPSPTQALTPRPSMVRASTFGARNTSSAAAATRAHPLNRNTTDVAAHAYGGRGEDIFTDDESTGSGCASPDWGNRSISSATSHDSLARINSMQLTKKAALPPPPPVNRAKKPPPPVPAPRSNLGYY